MPIAAGRNPENRNGSESTDASGNEIEGSENNLELTQEEHTDIEQLILDLTKLHSHLRESSDDGQDSLLNEDETHHLNELIDKLAESLENGNVAVTEIASIISEIKGHLQDTDQSDGETISSMPYNDLLNSVLKSCSNIAEQLNNRDSQQQE